MTAAKPKYVPEPRILNKYQVAALFGVSTAAFDRRLAEFEEKGFPAKNEFMGGWDAKAVHIWMDLQSGIASEHAVNDFYSWDMSV